MVLLDEIEKAHPEVSNILLQILEDGRLTDAQGRVVDFRHCIVIMTSNIGAATITRTTPLGFSVAEEGGGMAYEDMKGRIMGELKKAFRPELINRIDEIIVFHQLTKAEIKEIIDLMLVRLQKQMADQGVSFQLTDAAKDLLVDEGYDPAMGARPLRRAIQRLIEDPLADELLHGTLTEGLVIVCDRDGDVMRMDRTEPPPAPAEPEVVAAAVGADAEPADDAE